MLQLILHAAHALGLALWLAAMAYLLLAIVCAARWRRNAPPIGPAPPLTLLKPLCGDEPGLEESLLTFCRQAYPGPLQIIFGVQSPDDAAIAVVRRLIAAFPAIDMSLVVDAEVHGPNGKVSNLANMASGARHGLIAVSDSDACAEPECLRRATPSFADPAVGAVTCPYAGVPAPGSGRIGRLGALQIDAWYLPAAIVAARLAPVDSCYGPLTIVRREVLDRAGGFRALASLLADDHALGQISVAQGFKVVMAEVVVGCLVQDRSLVELLRHELRWARTTRATTPLAYAASLVTWCWPAVAGLILPLDGIRGLAALACLVALRMVLAGVVQSRLPPRFRLALAVFAPWTLAWREALCFAVWLQGFLGARVSWRGRMFRVVAGGQLVEDLAAPAPGPTG